MDAVAAVRSGNSIAIDEPVCQHAAVVALLRRVAEDGDKARARALDGANPVERIMPSKDHEGAGLKRYDLHLVTCAQIHLISNKHEYIS
jgi:hypothetical protein